MTPNPDPDQTNSTRTNSQRAELLNRLSSILWDETMPPGKEAVPESEWEEILTGPCRGDMQLVADVCQYERYLRSNEGSDTVEVSVPPERYLEFLFGFLQVKGSPLNILWDAEESEWHPEDNWDALLTMWSEGSDEQKDRLKKQACELMKVRETGRYSFFSA